MKNSNRIAGILFTFSCLIFCLSTVSFSQEKSTKRDVSYLADLFIKITQQQESESQTLRNGGFSAMTQNMGKYRVSMKEKNSQKTEIIKTIFKELESSKDSKKRKEAWSAIDKILKTLDIEKLKEIDESLTKNGYYGYKLHDFAIILDIKYSEMRNTLTKAKNQEKDSEIAKYAVEVMKVFEAKQVTEKK